MNPPLITFPSFLSPQQPGRRWGASLTLGHSTPVPSSCGFLPAPEPTWYGANIQQTRSEDMEVHGKEGRGEAATTALSTETPVWLPGHEGPIARAPGWTGAEQSEFGEKDRTACTAESKRGQRTDR